MKKSTKPIPQGFHTVTPSLTVRNGAEAIEFYKKALGAQENSRMAGPDGKIMHAELKIGDSIIFLADENPAMGSKSPQTLGGNATTLFLYVEDVDKVFDRAIAAGGKTNFPVADMFWGDRFGNFSDPYGHDWGVSTRTREMTKQEVDEAARKFYADMAQRSQRKTA